MSIVGDEHTVFLLAIIIIDIWFTFLAVPQPGACQESIVCDAGNDVSIFSIETRIESVITESGLVKYSVTVFGPEVEEGPGLPHGDVVGGQPGGGDAHPLPPGPAASAVPGVGVVAVEEVGLSDLDVRPPEVAGPRVDHGGGEAAHTARPRGRDDDGGGAEVGEAPHSRVQRLRGLVQQRLKMREN